MDLDSFRKDFEKSANRSVSLPIAGAIVWLAVGLISARLDERTGVLVLMFGTGAIFPLGLFVARLRGEALISSTNPLAKLMGLSVLMVNLLWALHVPLFLSAPEFVALSLGIGLGLHWIVYSWIVQHPVGIQHAVLRTALVLATWLMFPEHRLLAVGSAIALVYAITIVQMLTRQVETA